MSVIFLSNDSKKLRSGVVIPDYMFKIIIDLDKNLVVAYLLPNIKDTDDLNKYETSIEDIESKTGDVYPMPKDFKYGLNVEVSSNREEVKQSVCGGINK